MAIHGQRHTKHNIKCSNETTNHQINGSGTIELASNRKVITKDVEIKAEKTFIEEINVSFQLHTVELSKMNVNSQFGFMVQNMIEKMQFGQTRLWCHHIHHYVAIYVMLITTFLIFIYFFINNLNYPFHKSQNVFKSKMNLLLSISLNINSVAQCTIIY